VDEDEEGRSFCLRKRAAMVKAQTSTQWQKESQPGLVLDIHDTSVENTFNQVSVQSSEK